MYNATSQYHVKQSVTLFNIGNHLEMQILATWAKLLQNCPAQILVNECKALPVAKIVLVVWICLGQTMVDWQGGMSCIPNKHNDLIQILKA